MEHIIAENALLDSSATEADRRLRLLGALFRRFRRGLSVPPPALSLTAQLAFTFRLQNEVRNRSNSYKTILGRPTISLVQSEGLGAEQGILSHSFYLFWPTIPYLC